jgi:hypothetical protein
MQVLESKNSLLGSRVWSENPLPGSRVQTGIGHGQDKIITI